MAKKHNIWILAGFCILSYVFILAFQTDKKVSSKINGVSFVAPHKAITNHEIASVNIVHANWIALMPFAFSTASSPEVRFDHARQWWGERKEGVVETVKMAEAIGKKVLLKPHVWVREQGWPGDYELEDEADWRRWEDNYKDYIMTYARLADSLHVTMLCIGTEYRKGVVQRPAFWKHLIEEVRKVYSGKLTYAANWDNYQNISFWGDLDYIGIDAYFPLSTEKTPGVAQLKKDWAAILPALKNMYNKYNRPILFTEYGYRSIDHTTGGHWNYDQDTLEVNLQAQANAYLALYESVWDKPWFAGGFLWKWHAWQATYGGEECKRSPHRTNLHRASSAHGTKKPAPPHKAAGPENKLLNLNLR